MATSSCATISVEGMTCQSCVSNIETNIAIVAGVRSIKVSLANREAVVEYDSTLISSEQIAEKIDDMGFAAKVKPNSRDVTINIDGMTCMSCVRNIEGTIGARAGVKFVQVSLEKKLGYFKFDPVLTNEGALCEAIENMGFDASLVSDSDGAGAAILVINEDCDRGVVIDMPATPGSSSTRSKAANQDDSSISPSVRKVAFVGAEMVGSGGDKKRRKEKGRRRKEEAEEEEEDEGLEKCYMKVVGMTCGSCVNHIERSLLKMEGVRTVLVSLMAQKAEVKFDPAYVMPSQIANRVTELGYEATVFETESAGQATVLLRVRDGRPKGG